MILAAGDGKRMQSSLPKTCCQVLFKPMLSWVLDACRQADISDENICVVLSDTDTASTGLLGEKMSKVIQRERRGTGHAVQASLGFLKNIESREIRDITVLCSDAPFMNAATLLEALAYHRENRFAATVISAVLDKPDRYGRIIRKNGVFSHIVEAADATQEELAIKEINSGAFWFSVNFLIEALPLLQNNNAQNEYYLTDMLSIARQTGFSAGAFPARDPAVALGANDRTGLSLLNMLARAAVLDTLRQNGVDIPIDDGIIISPDAVIGADTQILPGCIIKGRAKIGSGCTLGPNTTIINCEIGDGCKIESSRLEDSRIGSLVRIGPFAQIRPNCRVSDEVKIGNFVELKNSVVGEKTSVAHLTYIGDSDFGSGINVGCGVVTVNYDGNCKYRTVVGDGAFIGCNANLIAPVHVGEGAYIAAACTVNTDVLPSALAIGRVPMQQKEGWAKRFLQKKK